MFITSIFYYIATMLGDFHTYFWTGRGSLIDWDASGTEMDFCFRHILSWRFSHENITTAFFLFRWLKKSRCQLMAKECTLSTGKLPLGGLPGNSVVPVCKMSTEPMVSLDNVHGLPGHCPWNQWKVWTKSMDTLDKVQGAHSDWTMSNCPLSPWTNVHIHEHCQWAQWTISMDSVDIVHQHCPVYSFQYFSLQCPWKMSIESMDFLQTG